MSDHNPTVTNVVVTDIRMRFGSMVVFMIKWALASIPAFLLLLLAGTIFWAFVAGMFLTTAFTPRATAQPESAPTGAQAPSAGSVDDGAARVYLQQLEVLGVRVGDGITGKGVFGEIKNAGERSLDEVEITIYCLGADDRPIFEKTYRPVLVSSMGFGNDNTPLKPGYSRKFGVRLDDAPSGWAGKVDVKATSVKFSSGA